MELNSIKQQVLQRLSCVERLQDVCVIMRRMLLL